MPAPAEQTKRLVKFPVPFQGYNSTAPSLVLTKGYCPKVDGIRFGQGEVASLPGLTSLGQPGDFPINGAFTQSRADGTILTLAAQRNAIMSLDNSSFTWAQSVFSTGAVGLDEDFWSFTDVFGDVYGSNGVGMTVWSPDGGSWTDLNAGATPLGYSGRYLETFAGRLMMANTREGSSQHEDRLRWSVAQSPRDFSSDASAGANDIVDLAGPITGMKALGGRLFVHKRSGITVVIETGLTTPSFSFQTIVDGIGALAGRTLLSIRGVHIFLGYDDVYMYDGASAPLPIGEPIRRELFDTLNYLRLNTAWAVDYPDFHEYRLFVPTGTDLWPKTCFIFNYVDKTWTKRTHSTAATAGALWQITPIDDTWDGGLNNTWDTGNDSTDDSWDAPGSSAHLIPFFGQQVGTATYPDESLVAIGQTNTLETADWDLDKPGTLKTVDRVRATFRQRNAATISLSISTDGGATFTTPTTAAVAGTAGDGTPITTAFFPVNRRTGEFFRLRLSSPSRFSLASWELETIDRTEVR
jgi:hypothetical protein